MSVFQPVAGMVFLSTLPARGATEKLAPLSVSARISIHAPRKRSDAIRRRCRTVSQISIHAPRKRSDLAAAPLDLGVDNFYPRSPQEERLHLEMLAGSAPLISIHAPRKRSDHGALGVAVAAEISIHAPRKRSDGKIQQTSKMDFA